MFTTTTVIILGIGAYALGAFITHLKAENKAKDAKIASQESVIRAQNKTIEELQKAQTKED